MHPGPTFILLLLLSCFPFLAEGTNFTHCLEDLRNDPNAVGGVDFRGNWEDPKLAAGIIYDICKKRCGAGPESFSWRDSTQLFASWLLPWLALVSQLPFGSGNHADDFASVIVSLGSPALAAYSLVITALNARSVHRRVKRLRTDEDKSGVARVLISLQQFPLELTQSDRLLAFIQANNHWRRPITSHLDRRNAWSIAAGTSVAWVVLAFLFTLTDSFVSLDAPGQKPPEGQAVGTLWLWLLCLVVGWLWVPTFTSGELRNAVGRANMQVAREAAELLRQQRDRAARRTTAGLPRPAQALGRHGNASTDDREYPGDGTDSTTIPMHELIYPQSAVYLQTPPEGGQDYGHIVGANQSVTTLPHSIAQNSVYLEENGLFVVKDLNGLNRDERRTPATFNYSRIMRYLVLVNDVLRALDRSVHRNEEEQSTSGLAHHQPSQHLESGPTPNRNLVVFPSGALATMFNAFIAALVLQCGIGATATAIVIFTPTIGLGCRSLAYIIYGSLSIMILILTIVSTISARISETRNGRSNFVKKSTEFIAVSLRKACFLLALLNATGLIVVSTLQLTSIFDTCYCNASVLGRGSSGYIVVSFAGWVGLMKTARIIAIIVSGVTVFVYMGFLWLMSAPPVHADGI